jgi:hypothetical protein
MPNRFVAENREKTMSLSCLPSLLLPMFSSLQMIIHVSFFQSILLSMPISHACLKPFMKSASMTLKTSS